MRGGEEEDDREEDAAIKGPDGPIPPFPLWGVLAVQDGCVPFWNTSFMNGAAVKQCIVGQECLLLS